ncbi:TonB-dependent receptor [Sphingopyxis sp. CCNWLW253]|uniref:TonB-dependent receptor domain-containing protein n=1 Tax=unclassified Sphingopyxis TaxID=2614943 RepID=UPI003012B074
MTKTAISLRLACSTAALVLAGVTGTVFAQSTTSEPDAVSSTGSSTDADERAADEAIIVTGTNISGVKPVGNLSTVVTADDAVKAGYSTPAELLRTLPQVRSGEYDSDGGRSTISLQNSSGANTVSLRGLGGSAGTLILIDGRRSVQVGTNTNGTEVNQVPLAALQRIEVIADGASAVYGSDAVAGVINYIIRKDYDGAEVTFRANNNSGGMEYGADATVGTKWDTGNILVAYGYTHRDSVRAGKSPYLDFDGRPLGGYDRRIDGANATTGFVPNIVVAGPANATIPRAFANTYYGLPTGANVGLSPAQLRLNDPNLSDLADFTDYVGDLERHQVAIYANQQLGDNVEVFLQGNYLNRETLTRSGEGVSSVTPVVLRQFLRNSAGAVTATPNPFYISGIPGVAPGADLNVQYATLKDGGPKLFKGSDETYNVTAGVRASLPFEWKVEAFYTYGRNKGCGYCLVEGSYTNPVALQYQIDIGAINPLSSNSVTAAQLATFRGNQTQIGHNGLDDAVIKFNGPLFDLPGGTVRAAVGGERIKTFNYNVNTSVAGTNNAVVQLTNKANSLADRTVWSAFGEVYVPFVGEEMNVPLIKSFVVNAAVRYDDYSDVGQTTNPKFGATWEVNDFLTLYGSWGTSYTAPTLADLNPSAYVSGTVTNLIQPYNAGQATAAGRLAQVDLRFSPISFLPEAFCGNIIPGQCVIPNMALLFGANPNIRPQTSTNWTLGAELKPGGGFRASINYYNIDFKNRVVFPLTLQKFLEGRDPGSTPPTYRGYEQFVIPISNPATCSNADLSTADPTLQGYLSRPIYGSTSGVGALAAFPNFCGIKGLIDSRFINLGRTRTEGLDVDLSWMGTAGEVSLNATASANVILRNDESIGPGAPVESRINLINTPIKWRGRAGVGAAYRGFTTTLFANYLGSFTNDDNRDPVFGQKTPIPVKIPSYTTFDLNLGYSTDFKGRDAGILKGLRGSITILNLFDKDPQTVVNGFGSYYAGRGTPFGRSVSLQVTGSF